MLNTESGFISGGQLCSHRLRRIGCDVPEAHSTNLYLVRFDFHTAPKSAPSQIQAHEYGCDSESNRETNRLPLTRGNRNGPGFQHLKIDVLQLLRKHVWDEKPTETQSTIGERPYEASGYRSASPRTVHIHETGYSSPDNKSNSQQNLE